MAEPMGLVPKSGLQMRPSPLRLSPLAAGLAACLSCASPVQAAVTTAADNDDALLAVVARKAPFLTKVEVLGESDNGYVAERITSATRTDTPLIDVPQSVSVVTAELIRDQAMQGISDVVRYVPGVGMAQGEGNRDTPIFRGSASTADLFIDGMRDDVQYFRDLYNIERVEVYKGPNAMSFGRGGSGGLVNRVSKQADGESIRSLSLHVGSWDRYRATVDIGGAASDRVDLRIAGLYEDGDSFRDGYSAHRRGLNPTLSLHVGDATEVQLGYEHFEESRTADRGISSFNGRPLDVDASTFFGDPKRSTSTVDVDAINVMVEHAFAGGARLRNRTRLADYDKFYRNVYPGTAFGNGTVAISAYQDQTGRRNLLNQTDLVFKVSTGALEHQLLVGAEFGRQTTDNARVTGFFPSSRCPSSASQPSTTVTCVPIANPRYEGTLNFIQSGSDADRHSVASGTAFYLQDQIEINSKWQAIIGLRHDHFDVDLLNNRNGQRLEAKDDVLSPRIGLIYKLRPSLSLYANHSVAFLPRSGEQLGSLALNNAALEPEKFTNAELGAKWDVNPSLSATFAIYQLDRSNVAVVDPSNPANLILLAGDSQRVRGAELGIAGKLTKHWSVMGGVAWQDAEIVADIKSSSTGAVIPKGTVLAQVPRRTFALWNRYDLNQRWGVGLGLVSRSSVYTSTSNSVTLPGFGRVDGAVFLHLSDQLDLQLNVENLLDKRYYASAHSDTNISPGSPRAFNLGINYNF